MGRENDRIGAAKDTHRAGTSSLAAAAAPPPPAYHEQDDKDLKATPSDAKETDDVHSITSVNSSLPPASIHDPEVPPSRGPDINHPFAFPVDPPSYPGPPFESASFPGDAGSKRDPSATTKIIAIPQQFPIPESTFLPAYPPALLPYGIPSQTFVSFLQTLSTFLNATASDAAIAHASKLARSTAIDIPKSLGRGIAHDTTSGVKQIGKFLKRGNAIGALSVIVGYPFGLTGRLIGSVFMVPAALAQRPQTPRERADVYVEATNRKWWNPRGLHGRLMNSAELTSVLGVTVGEFLQRAHEGKGRPQGIMNGLGEWFEPVRVEDALVGVTEGSGKGKARAEPPAELRIERETLWLVIVQGEVAAEAMSQAKKARNEQKRRERDLHSR